MKLHISATAAAALFLLTLLAHTHAQAAIVEYDLTVAQQEVNITGKPAHGMTINNDIPGPTLHFTEGDVARIRVHNKMSVATSIHWHGLLVPPEMDGVPFISFPPIQPGATFSYEFPLRQSGTYWYHSHTGMQEQRGVYGAIVIAPRQHDIQLMREHVVVLSDWSDEDPHMLNRTLKRGSEWYAIQKGSGQSIFGAARLGMLGDYFKRELQRMPAMDIADLAYDRFLANGAPESSLAAKPNETVRLRIVDGSSTTFFHLEFAGGPMSIVAADGMDVEPVEENRFLIGVAETYDVLVQVPAAGVYEFRATAHDGSGHASVWIGSGARHPAPDVPKPNIYHGMGGHGMQQIFALTPAGSMGMPDRDVEAGKFDQPGMRGMEGMHQGAGLHNMAMDNMDHAMHAKADEAAPAASMVMAPPMAHGNTMQHTFHAMPVQPPAADRDEEKGTDFGFLADDVSSSKNLAIDGMSPSRPWTPYAKLRATKPTAFAKDKPSRDIRLTLDGDMERYVWFLNNTPLTESDAIHIRAGEVVRFIMINRTMMHHPMHLHGHFFRVINGQGDFAPLKHTVNVEPMSTTVIEFAANEIGDWFFHCHLLYHMEAGMARVVHYEDFTPAPEIAAIRPELYKDSWWFWGQADALSNLTEGFLTLANTRNILTVTWEAGWQDVDDTEWEKIVSWDRYVNRFFTVFAGANLLGANSEIEDTRGVLGLRYLLPFNLESAFWFDADGGARLSLEKSLALTPRLALFSDVQYDTHAMWEGHAGLSYMVNKHFSLVGQWHSEYGLGGGLQMRF